MDELGVIALLFIGYVLLLARRTFGTMPTIILAGFIGFTITSLTIEGAFFNWVSFLLVVGAYLVYRREKRKRFKSLLLSMLK